MIQNVLNAISIIAFVMSLYNFLLSILRDRRNLTYEIRDIFLDRQPHVNKLYVDLLLINKSRFPITITKIDIGFSNRNKFRFDHHGGKLLRGFLFTPSTNKEKTLWEFYTEDLPICLNSFEGKGGIFRASIRDLHFMDKYKDRLIFTFYTNRGTVVRKLKSFTVDFAKTPLEALEPNLELLIPRK